MILGLSLPAFTQLHVIISIVGIISGLVALVGMLQSRYLEVWTEVFLASTVLTSVTGFMFPFSKVLPSHVVGGISLVVLAVAIAGLYVFRLSGSYRWVYVAAALVALYLNVFVGVVQSFQKLEPLQRLAPTQSEPPFLVAQIVVLVLFGWLGYRAVQQFHPKLRPA